jgi:hypothetical protein
MRWRLLLYFLRLFLRPPYLLCSVAMDYVSNLCSLGAMPLPRRSHLSFIAVILAAIVDVLFLLPSPTWHHVFVLIKEGGGRASKFYDRK